MKYAIATSTLAACLISFGAAVGLQAQSRADNDFPQSSVQRYEDVHHLSSRERADFERRAHDNRLTDAERREMMAMDRRNDRRDDRRDDRATSYRYRMGRSYRTTTVIGAQLLQHAVNEGYQEGWEAGRMAARQGHRFQPTRERAYRDGSVGYSNVLPRDDYRNYFREGFSRGYEDGFYSRNRYGSYANGRATILGSVLGGILGFEIH